MDPLAVGCAELALPHKLRLKGYQVSAHIISLLRDNHYPSSQYFTVCCLYNSFTKLFTGVQLFLHILSQCRKVGLSCYWWHQTSDIAWQFWWTMAVNCLQLPLGVILAVKKSSASSQRLCYLLVSMKNLKLHEILILTPYWNTHSNAWHQLIWGDSRGAMLWELYHLHCVKLRRKPLNKVAHLLLFLPPRSVLQNARGHTKLCQTECSIALMNQWISFIHDWPCQLFSVCPLCLQVLVFLPKSLWTFE